MKDFKLDNYSKPGLNVPDGYFEQFPEKVMSKIRQEPEVIPIFRKSRWLMAVAAVLVLALTIPILNKFLAPADEPDLAAIESYIISHSEISEYDIAELLETEDIQKIKFDAEIEDNAIEDVLSSNTDLENYIID